MLGFAFGALSDSENAIVRQFQNHHPDAIARHLKTKSSLEIENHCAAHNLLCGRAAKQMRRKAEKWSRME